MLAEVAEGAEVAETLFGVSEVQAVLILFGAVGLVITLGLLLLVLSSFLVICKPNEIVVISGRRTRLPDGTVVGYKVLHGGRSLRIPGIETIHRMDTRLMPVTVEVHEAYSRGGIALTVQAIANIKVTSSPSLVRNAVERCLSMSQQQIATVAQQTLEGVLREVVAELTPEEVNEDRLKFAETLVKHATDDLEKLGLDLDVLKIQNVTDQRGYLANLGRAQIARIVRDAENAENAAKQALGEAQSRARQRSEVAQKEAESLVLTRRNSMRATLATLEGEVRSVELEADVAAQAARAEAEQELQQLRAEQERLRLDVEMFLPAEAARLASEADARGSAAPLAENGRASAEALSLVATAWQSAGAEGRDLYVLQNLKSLVEAAVSRVSKTQVNTTNVVDSGDGEAFRSAVAAYPAAVSAVVDETARAMGVDLSALLARKEVRR